MTLVIVWRPDCAVSNGTLKVPSPALCDVLAHCLRFVVTLLPKEMALLQISRQLQGMLFAMLLAMTTPLHAQQQPHIQDMVPLCFGCHGPNGVSESSGIPSLAGQNETYLLKRLLELKAQQAPSETMQGVTHDISNDDLKLLANFFARQRYVRNVQSVDQAKLARGRDVYNRVCNMCHKEEGRATVFAEYPLLAGQSLNYMLNELDHILSRKREVEITKIGTLVSIPRDQIEDAIHFFASQLVSPEQVKNNVNEPIRGSKRFRNKE